jgi:hypothetical protein
MANIDMENKMENIAAWKKDDSKSKIPFCSKKTIHHCMHMVKTLTMSTESFRNKIISSNLLRL